MRSFLFSFLSSFSFAFSSMLSVRLVATKPEMTTAVENWTEQVRAGDVRAISRAVSAIENREPEAEEILRTLFPHTGNAYRVGITGAPGTGKSTLVDRLVAHYRRDKKAVGIIAVDPSSPFTGGAIPGDRIRMRGHCPDRGGFFP